MLLCENFPPFAAVSFCFKDCVYKYTHRLWRSQIYLNIYETLRFAMDTLLWFCGVNYGNQTAAKVSTGLSSLSTGHHTVTLRCLSGKRFADEKQKFQTNCSVS